MKVTKKIVAAVLMLMLVLGSIMFTPGQAKADDYVLGIDGKSFTAAQAAGNLSGAGWSWNAAAKVINLDGYNGERIYYYGDFTLRATSTSTITAEGTSAVRAYGDLFIEGEADLTINAFDTSASVIADADIVIGANGGNTVQIHGDQSDDWGTNLSVVEAGGDVYLLNNGIIKITGRGYADGYTNGIKARNALIGWTEGDDTYVNIDVEGCGSFVAGINLPEGDIVIDQNASVTIDARHTNYGEGYAIAQGAQDAAIALRGTGQQCFRGSSRAIDCWPDHEIIAPKSYHVMGSEDDPEMYLFTSNLETLCIGEEEYYGDDFVNGFEGDAYYWDTEKQELVLKWGKTVPAIDADGNMLVIGAYESEETPYASYYIRAEDEPAISSGGGLAIFGEAEINIWSEYRNVINVMNRLYLWTDTQLSINVNSGEYGFFDGVTANEIIASGDGNISITAYTDNDNDYSDAVNCSRLQVGVSKEDSVRMGITITGENECENYGLRLWNDSVAKTYGHASLDINAYNFSKGEDSVAYAIDAESGNNIDFSGSDGTVKLFGGTAAATDDLADEIIGTGEPQMDGRYIEKLYGKTDLLFIEGDWIPSSDMNNTQSGAGWSWNPGDQTLTLNGYNGGAILAQGDCFNIRLANNTDNVIDEFLSTNGSLVIQGGGNLTVNGTTMDFSAIEAKRNIIFKGTGTVTVNQLNAQAYVLDGIKSGGDIFVLGQKVLVNQSGSQEEYDNSPICGVKNHGLLLVTGRLSVDSNLKTQDLPYNIRIGIDNEDGAVVVMEEGVITARERAAGFSVGIYSQSPVILDGIGGPIYFQGASDGVTAGYNQYGFRVLYNDNYTQYTSSDWTYWEYALSGRYFELATKKTKTLTPTIGTASQVKWTSSNTKVATVSSTGKVSALTYGRVIIRAALKSNPAIYEEWTIQTRFYDVTKSSKYYFKPVYWAADGGITKGYDGVYFGVDEDCTRGQLMVFLWRMAGKPDVSDVANPFKDVKESELGSTYYKAILWGYSEGITKGYTISGKKYFKPNDSILRKDIMIMLYRYVDKPAWWFWDERPESGFTFPDVVGVYDQSSDTYNAIAWAYVNKITNGYSGDSPYAGQFGALLNCNRQDIVTFLYRMYNQPFQSY